MKARQKKNYIILQSPPPSFSLCTSLQLCSVYPFYILPHCSTLVSCMERCSESSRLSDLWLILWKILKTLYKGNRLKLIHKPLTPPSHTHFFLCCSMIFMPNSSDPPLRLLNRLGLSGTVSPGEILPPSWHTHTRKLIHIPAVWPSHAYR